MESTYGGRFHKNTGDHVEVFARVIQETLDKGGNVVIPAFAVGRTQEVLNYIRIIKEKNLVTGHGVFPVYLDSPMAVEATGVFKDNMMAVSYTHLGTESGSGGSSQRGIYI